MDFTTYARMLWRRWPLILVLALLAAGGAYGATVRAPRMYRATSQLSVTPSVIEFFTGEAIQRLLNNYALVLKSRKFAAEVGGRMQPAQAADDVAGKVRAVAAPAEYRIAIEVDDPDPHRAQQIANAAASAFVDKIREENAGKERRDVQIDVLEQAELPGAPFSPRPRRDALGGAVLGALLGAGLALLLEFWDDTVKGADEAGALLGWPVLGAIPRPAQPGSGRRSTSSASARRPSSLSQRHQSQQRSH